MKRILFACALTLILVANHPVAAQPASAGASAAKAFDPVAATQTYLDKMTPEQKARSDSYFEGGYWLQLWDFLIAVATGLFLLASGLSRRIRDFAERRIRWKPLQTGLYWVSYVLITGLIAYPMTVYEGFFREHKYKLATQTFGPWMSDQLKGLAITLVLGGLAMIALYGVLRRTPRTWWLWGSLTLILILVVASLIAPVYINPIFNTYTPVTNAAIRDPILSMARANGIPARNVYEFDASRQTTRVSANVSGFMGTMRISLNDNLLKRAGLPEIEAVMGHEMGHYVLNHVYKFIVMFGVLIVVVFSLVRWSFDRILIRRGAEWGIRDVGDVGDVAGLPLLALLITACFFVLTPVANTIIRTEEAEADIFGINTSRQPDGMAEAALKLGEYRKMNPGPIEEFLFFDHPSGHNRILMAMRWKAENLPEAQRSAGTTTTAVP